MGKNDKKGGGDKGGKGKGSDSKEAGGKTKGAQLINVRHILVRTLLEIQGKLKRLTMRQCEKHAKKEEALAKLNEGVKFDEVARQYSEDKARTGSSPSFLFIIYVFFCDIWTRADS